MYPDWFNAFLAGLGAGIAISCVIVPVLMARRVTSRLLSMQD